MKPRKFRLEMELSVAPGVEPPTEEVIAGLFGSLAGIDHLIKSLKERGTPGRRKGFHPKKKEAAPVVAATDVTTGEGGGSPY